MREQRCADGTNPSQAPIQGINGSFYGTTIYGGSQGYGVVYEITPAGLYGVLHSFCSLANCDDGSWPTSLVQDASGNIYGTAIYGGSGSSGTVFKITPAGDFVVLHAFHGGDGAHPYAGPTLANDGNLYGTTGQEGGPLGSAGNIFELTSDGVFTALYSFSSTSGNISVYPEGLFQATDGVLYGVTQDGGDHGFGTIFSLSNNLSPLVETVPVAGKVGSRVIILGNDLKGSSSVTFNGTPAAFTVKSDTYITARVPAGATTGTVSVVTPSGALNSNPQFVVVR